MRPLSPSTEPDDLGSAALEFILVGCLLLVPVVYLIVALGMIQGQVLGSEAAARHAARAVSLSSGTADADRRVEAVLASVIADYGMDAEHVAVSVACGNAAVRCPEAGAVLTVTVRTEVSLPLVPPVLGLERLAAIPIEASAVQRVSRTWGDE
jgi:Flp pilus assembly protein TadG